MEPDPTTAGSPGPFLTARWSELVMVNWEVDPGALAERVPAGTELDFYQGRTFLSLVGFRFLDTRVLGLPIPGHRDFDEVNLRFYVRRREGDEVRRGVVFVKEIVPRRAIAAVARLVYNEPYVALPMHHDVQVTEAGGKASYAWRAEGRWHQLGVRVAGLPARPEAGSEPEFIAEHYWGYTRQRDGGTVEYRVEHPPWRVWEAEDIGLDLDPEALYGPGLGHWLQGPPATAFLAEGSAVVVRRGRRLA